MKPPARPVIAADTQVGVTLLLAAIAFAAVWVVIRNPTVASFTAVATAGGTLILTVRRVEAGVSIGSIGSDPDTLNVNATSAEVVNISAASKGTTP